MTSPEEKEKMALPLIAAARNNLFTATILLSGLADGAEPHQQDLKVQVGQKIAVAVIQAVSALEALGVNAEELIKTTMKDGLARREGVQ